MIGTTVGHYCIIEALGRGASGTVYRAVDGTLGREVAIKVLNRDGADADAIERFHIEATILAKLNHPAIATIHELFRCDTNQFMVMELVRGETLDALCDRVGRLSTVRSAAIVRRVLSAVDHAHRSGVFHGDMKPANVMITEGGGVKIMDFGVARVRGASRSAADRAMMGTPAYMAPEQVLGGEVDGRADVYAIGVILYRLLTGTLPFPADTAVGVLRRQISDTAAPPSAHCGELPAWCDAIVARALAKSPDDRFQTADEFREALAHANGTATTSNVARLAASITAEQPPPERSGAGTDTVVLARSGRRWLRLTAASIAVVAIVFAVGLLESATRRRPQTAPAIRADDIALAAEHLPPVREPAPLAPHVDTAPARKPPPRLTFDAKTLVSIDHNQHVDDAQLVLDGGKVSVVGKEGARRPLYSVPFDSVIAISYSHSRDPLWRSPTGVLRVTRIDRGPLALLGIGGDRHWISLRTLTSAKFVVLRVREEDVSRILSALQQRTGVSAQRVPDRNPA